MSTIIICCCHSVSQARDLVQIFWAPSSYCPFPYTAHLVHKWGPNLCFNNFDFRSQLHVFSFMKQNVSELRMIGSEVRRQ